MSDPENKTLSREEARADVWTRRPDQPNLSLASRRRVRAQIRLRCRQICDDAFWEWQCDLFYAIARGEVKLEDINRWRPAAPPTGTKET
jgi:hypothetical protein